MVAALLHLAPPVSKTFGPPIQPQKTVQISIDVEADVIITDHAGKRLGFDRTLRRSVNEIPESRMIEREGATTFVLPYKSVGDLYVVAVYGNSPTVTPANISMAGPGFVVGVRALQLKIDEVQTVDLSPNGKSISLTTGHDGPVPQIFLTTQSERSKPSYRFEVGNSFLSRGKRIWIELNSATGELLLASNETRKTVFTINMRRTNPGGTRDLYTQHDISFGRDNSYSMDFGKWDGKGEIRFCEGVRLVNAPCTSLKNEAFSSRPN